MNPDENVEDPARKTQEFDPALVDEEGINPESAQGAEPIVLQQEQRERKLRKSRVIAAAGIHSKHLE